MRLNKITLTLWLISPIAVVVLLCVWIVVSLQSPPVQTDPRIGAGAGDTGGANALGEYLRSRALSRDITISVENRADLPPDAQLLLAYRSNDFDGEPMQRGPEGRWSLTVKAGELADGFEILADLGEVRKRDAAGRRMLVVTAGEQLVVLRNVSPE